MVVRVGPSSGDALLMVISVLIITGYDNRNHRLSRTKHIQRSVSKTCVCTRVERVWRNAATRSRRAPRAGDDRDLQQASTPRRNTLAVAEAKTDRCGCNGSR